MNDWTMFPLLKPPPKPAVIGRHRTPGTTTMLTDQQVQALRGVGCSISKMLAGIRTAAREFARTMNRMLGQLPPEMRPQVPWHPIRPNDDLLCLVRGCGQGPEDPAHR